MTTLMVKAIRRKSINKGIKTSGRERERENERVCDLMRKGERETLIRVRRGTKVVERYIK